MEHKVMLAPSKLAEITNLSYPVLVQPKYDGFRATYIPEIGFLSRTGKPFRNKYLKDYFSSILKSPVVLDGELYIPDTSLQDIQSVVTSGDARINVKLQFRVFDAIPLEDWESRSCALNCASRVNLVRKTVNDCCDYSKILDVATDKVNSSAELIKIYKKCLTSGLEGVMIKDEEGLYKWGRVGADKRILKLKPMLTEDFKVIEIFEGEGKNAGMAGGLIMDTGTKNILRVGTGFNNDERQDMFDNQCLYIGRTAEIKYMGKTKDGNFRQPVFYRWRDDK